MICPYSLTVPGGVQEQVLGLARKLRSNGIDVRVLAPCDGPPPETGITPLGASLPTSANGSVAPIAPDLPAQLRLVRALYSERFDLIHLHEPLAPGVGISTVLMQAAPMIGTFHAAGRSSAYKYINRGCRSLRSRLSLACAVSQDAEDLASRWLGGSYERVFNGIDVNHYSDCNPYVDANDDGEVPSIMFIGRHDERKGLEVLLKALQLLERETLKLWVAGDGEQTHELQNRFKHDQRIEWLGRISDREKRERLRAATLFCAPSLGGESFGIVLLEAMASKTAVIASDIDGYRQVAKFGKAAKLTPPGDVEALAESIRYALKNPAETTNQIEAGFARANEFSMQALAELYIEKYERIMRAEHVKKPAFK